MTKSGIFLYLSFAFLVGVFIASFLKFNILALLVVADFGVLLISVFWKYKRIVVLGFCVLFSAAGIWRYISADSPSKLEKFSDDQIEMIGTIVAEPDVKEKITQLTVNVKQVVDSEQSISDIDENILVTVNKYPLYQYGDLLKISGKLQLPDNPEGFNYQEYLKKDGINYVMSWPKVQLTGHNQGSFFISKIIGFKTVFEQSTRKFISPPQEGILEALVFGDESNIPKTWKDKLNTTGTRHITAVSGMNITIISSLIFSFLLALGLWRQQAFYISLTILFVYILMVGAPASAVRAGFMAGLLMIAQHYGRASAASRSIIFAALLMVIFNPFLLRFDVGFQLSFLAVLGMVLLKPTLSEWFKKVPENFQLRSVLATTLSAQIFTLPILVFNFGRIGLFSPISNILIVPILAPLTILIFIFGGAAMTLQSLAIVISWPVWFFLTYILKIIEFFSIVPFSSLVISGIPWSWLCLFYICLLFVIWRIREMQKHKFLNY